MQSGSFPRPQDPNATAAPPRGRRAADGDEQGKDPGATSGATLHVLPLGPREERLLAERVMAGDPDAFELLYHHFVGRVLGLARQMLGDAAAAEDAAQETFLRVFRKVHRFRGDSRLSTWIHRVAVNVCLDELGRRKRRRPEVMAPDPQALGGSPCRPCHTELRLSLDDLLSQLSPKQRLAFYLCHVEGFSAAEIAEITGERAGAVHKRLQRTRKALAERWRAHATDHRLDRSRP